MTAGYERFDNLDALIEKTEWTTQELTRDFAVVGFYAGYCVAKRRSDGQLGSLTFGGHPRVYTGWTPHDE